MPILTSSREFCSNSAVRTTVDVVPSLADLSCDEDADINNLAVDVQPWQFQSQ